MLLQGAPKALLSRCPYNFRPNLRLSLICCIVREGHPLILLATDMTKLAKKQKVERFRVQRPNKVDNEPFFLVRLFLQRLTKAELLARPSIHKADNEPCFLVRLFFLCSTSAKLSAGPFIRKADNEPCFLVRLPCLSFRSATYSHPANLIAILSRWRGMETLLHAFVCPACCMLSWHMLFRHKLSSIGIAH